MSDRAKIVNKYLDQINNPGFDISQVRKELQKERVDEEEIKIIVRLVDNEIQRRLQNDISNNKAFDLVYIGAFISAIGLLITIGTYTGIIDMGNSFLIAYGPLLSGLAIMFSGLAKRK